MGCGSSKGKTKQNKKINKNKNGEQNRSETYRQRTGFRVDQDMMNLLHEHEKHEFVTFPDYTEYFSRTELPEDKYIPLLQAIINDNAHDYRSMLTEYKLSTIDLVTGIDQTVEFGSEKNVNGTDLNPLHWAVYNNNLDAVKTVIENQVFNILVAGKVPSNTGLANDSEISIDEPGQEDEDDPMKGSFRRKLSKRHGPLTMSEKRYGSIPRSLILFWAIDHENIEIFEYLWNLENINWGLKNLKFNLAMICIKENPKLLDAFLFSETFSRIVNHLPFDEAMDFLEAFIVKNDRISDDIKAELFEESSMIVYDFMGELMSLENIAHLRELHSKLDENDFAKIKSSKKAMEKIKELREFVENMDNSEEQEEIEHLLGEFED